MLHEQADRVQQHLPFLASGPCVSVLQPGAAANDSDEILLQLSIQLSPETASNDAALKMLAIHVTVLYIKVFLIKRHVRNLFYTQEEPTHNPSITTCVIYMRSTLSVTLIKLKALEVMH